MSLKNKKVAKVIKLDVFFNALSCIQDAFSWCLQLSFLDCSSLESVLVGPHHLKISGGLSSTKSISHSWTNTKHVIFNLIQNHQN